MNKNNRDCNVHELGDRLTCQRESHVEGESNERIWYTYFNQPMRANHSKKVALKSCRGIPSLFKRLNIIDHLVMEYDTRWTWLQYLEDQYASIQGHRYVSGVGLLASVHPQT